LQSPPPRPRGRGGRVTIARPRLPSQSPLVSVGWAAAAFRFIDPQGRGRGGAGRRAPALRLGPPCSAGKVERAIDSQPPRGRRGRAGTTWGGGRGTPSGNSAPRPHSRGRERSKGAAPLAPPKQAGGKPKCLDCSGGSRWRGRAGAGAAGPQTLGRPARGQAGKEIGAGFRLCDLSSPRTLQKRGGGRRADMGAPGGGDRRAGSDTAGGAPRRGRAGGGGIQVLRRALTHARICELEGGGRGAGRAPTDERCEGGERAGRRPQGRVRHERSCRGAAGAAARSLWGGSGTGGIVGFPEVHQALARLLQFSGCAKGSKKGGAQCRSGTECRAAKGGSTGGAGSSFAWWGCKQGGASGKGAPRERGAGAHTLVTGGSRTLGPEAQRTATRGSKGGQGPGSPRAARWEPSGRGREGLQIAATPGLTGCWHEALRARPRGAPGR
jgi:hypothetical protein